eukprot:GSChrysophyteH1.ASY1.ANO1.371.1 assembled CDS
MSSIPEKLKQLQQQCVVPEITNDVHISEYLQIGAQMYADSVKSGRMATSVRYVSLKRFLLFMTKLHAHNGFSSVSIRKQRLFLERCMRNCLQDLEAVVKTFTDEMEEGSKIVEVSMKSVLTPESLRDEDLFDMFEGDENSVAGAGPGASAIVDASASASVDSAAAIHSSHLSAKKTDHMPTAVPTLRPSAAAKPTSSNRDRDPAKVRAAFDLLRPVYEQYEPLKPIGDQAIAIARGYPKAVNKDAPDSAFVELHPPRTGEAAGASRGGGAAVECAAAASGVGVSSVEKKMLAALLHASNESIYRVDPGAPFSTDLEFRLHRGSGISMARDDYYVSYSQVLKELPPQLQANRAAVETNRCFFLHLGIAISVHPFVLQCAFRHLAEEALLDKDAEDYSLKEDILSSVLSYAAYVDANALLWLWVAELTPYRICVLSGSREKPILSIFRAKGQNTTSDVLLHYDGHHFTLLRSRAGEDGRIRDASPSIVPQLMQIVQANAGILQEHEVTAPASQSVTGVIRTLVRQ